MNQLEVLKQINILTSALLSVNTDNQMTLKKYIENHYIPFQKNAKKDNIFYFFMIILYINNQIL